MKQTLGILGGGQLGRMLALEARRMGYGILTLDPQADSPCGQVADEQIIAAYDDLDAVAVLGARSDLLTYEFENVPPATVAFLEEQKKQIAPSSRVLSITQDRLHEKRFLTSCGLETAPYVEVSPRSDLAEALLVSGCPAILKTRRGGYDGKGQWPVRHALELEQAIKQAATPELMLEGFVAFEREVSIIATRNAQGHIITFPLAENQHDAGILAASIVPARVTPAVAARMLEIAQAVGEGLDFVGTFAVECFLSGERVFVNEIAPRVHNTGHYTLDATSISQFETHLRAVAGLPLTVPRLLCPAVMINILGTGGGGDLQNLQEVLAENGTCFHWYGKHEATLRRKMGHVTVLAETQEEAIAAGERVRSRLYFS